MKEETGAKRLVTFRSNNDDDIWGLSLNASGAGSGSHRFRTHGWARIKSCANNQHIRHIKKSSLISMRTGFYWEIRLGKLLILMILLGEQYQFSWLQHRAGYTQSGEATDGRYRLVSKSIYINRGYEKIKSDLTLAAFIWMRPYGIKWNSVRYTSLRIPHFLLISQTMWKQEKNVITVRIWIISEHLQAKLCIIREVVFIYDVDLTVMDKVHVDLKTEQRLRP